MSISNDVVSIDHADCHGLDCRVMSVPSVALLSS